MSDARTNEDLQCKNKGWDASGTFVPAGLFIGMGIGWALGHLAEGLFIGLGAGILVMAVLHLTFGR